MNCPFGIICSIDNAAGLSINLNGNCTGGILHLSGADFKGFSDRLKHAAAKLIVDNRRENHAENLRGMTRAVMNVGGSLVGNRLYSNGVNSARLGASCACDIIRSKLARPGLVLNREVSLYSRRIGECFGALAVLLELTVNKAVYTADKLIDDGGHSGDFAASVVRLRNSCNALRTGLNAVNGLVEIRNYLSLCRGLGSSAAAALITALIALLGLLGSYGVAGSVGLSLGGLVAADGLSFAGLVVCNRLAVCRSVGLACGCVAVVLILLAGCKSKTKQRARTRAMIFFVISVTSEYEIFIQSRFFAVFSPERMSTKNQFTACAVVFIIK